MSRLSMFIVVDMSLFCIIFLMERLKLQVSFSN